MNLFILITNTFTLKFLLIFLANGHQSSSFHWDGNILYDLEATTETALTAEATNWTLSSYVTPGVKVYQCATYVLLGGYNILGGSGKTGANPYYGQHFARTYDSVPIHNQIYIQMLFYAVDSDSWSGNDRFDIGIDNLSIYAWTFNNLYTYSSKVCGNTVDDEIPPFTAYVSYPHSATSLTLKIINYADETSDNESLGFRDIKIEFLTISTPYSSLCSVSTAPLIQPTTSPCKTSCNSSDLAMSPSGSGICVPTSCSSACNTCAGSSTTCATCKLGEYMIDNVCYSDCNDPYLPAVLGGVIYCTTPCPGESIWWDESCYGNCSYSTEFSTFEMTENTVYTFSQCDFPCAANKYLYWNGSCESSCPEPLTNLTYKGKDFCEFACEEDQYLYWNNTCSERCDLPLVSEVQNGRKFCWYRCSENQYLYWNGSCHDKCDFPLTLEVQGTDKSRNFCWYGCPETQYLYWNGSCIDTCPSPLVSEIQQGTSSSRKFCWYGCSETQYLYWNGSCIDKCDLPLILEVQGTRNFCWTPCPIGQYICEDGSCTSECPLVKIFDPQIQYCRSLCEDLTDYIYSNDSCLATCSSPLSVEKNFGVQFCVNPCGTSDEFYLYENQTCLKSCESPYLKRVEPGVQYCDRPCSQPNIYWYQNASCLGQCKYPYVKLNFSGIIQCLPPCKKEYEYFNDYEKKCYSDCESPYKIEFIDVIKICKSDVSISHDEVEKLRETADSIDIQVKIVSGGMKAAGFIDSKNPNSALLAALSSMMQYIRYMKINFPPKVQMLFMVAARNPFTFNYGVNVPEFVEKHLEDDPLPYTFDKYDISSNFVSNLWDFMVSFSLQLLGVLAVTILMKMTVEHRKINILLKKILQALKWNFPIMMVCGSSGEIVFFASLQLRSSPFQGLSSTICCILSIFMMILVVLLLGIAFKIAHVMHRRRRQNLACEAKAEKWKGFEVLYVEYEEKSFFSLAYMFLFLSRNIIFNLTLATLFEYPLLECCIINGCNFLMVCYLIYLRPLKDLFALIQLWINEGLLNILSICVLILGILDYLEVEQEKTRNGMESVMLIVIQAFNFAALTFMVIGGLIFLRAVYRIWKTGRSKGMRSPLQIFNFLFFGDDDEKVMEKESDFSKKNLQIDKDFRENNMSAVELKGDSSIGNLICDTSIIQDPSTKILQSGEQATDFEMMSPQLFFKPQIEEFDKNLAQARKRKFKVKRRSNILENATKEINDTGLKNHNDTGSNAKSDADNELWFLKFRKLKARLNWNAEKTDLTIGTNISNL